MLWDLTTRIKELLSNVLLLLDTLLQKYLFTFLNNLF